MKIFAEVVSIAIAVVGIVLFVRAIARMVRVLRLGQPAARTDRPVKRGVTLLKESLGHTRMLQWHWVGAGHWFIFVGFGLLFFTLVTAFGQLFNADYALPVLGHWFVFEWAAELFTVMMLIAIVAFIAYRRSRPKERERGVKGRLYGSTMWQGYFVEAVILGVGLCIAVLRGAEYALAQQPGQNRVEGWHYPFSFVIGKAMEGLSTGTIENVIYLTAMVKILVSFIWMITISLTPTMGVAWHRFTAFFNIFFKRRSDGGTALGGLASMMMNGEVIDFEDLEDMDEDTVLGVGKVEDFSWKGLLDFTSCTECGRCQSQCPAWNTDKPLSPKLLITALRNHAYAKAPYLLAESEEARTALPETVLAEAERPLVGATEGEWAWMPEGGAVIDDDVLWSCTSCGACVQQCPVDIEHVDHIIDMRRYQILVESNFPAELNGLFKGLENKGNPWNMSQKARLDWAQGLDFEVKVVGEDVESLDEVDWLFWVGCAGAYEDRAKKTTRAVAELLNMAGVDFAVLGNGETCTGDPARRAGNEFVFQGLATQNAETFKETKAKKVVATCAHCFNTLKNEYSQFGVELEVVHHTQLLNRLVREKKLTPVASQGGKRSITYHDPCYLGRHNQVYSPPRELLTVIPDAEFTEMPRNSERSFCCGAGGARMWMEESIGERINMNRTAEAIETGADQIAVGCPFCRVMLSDGLTMKQSQGEAREEVEVLDVAQMLLASIKGEAPKAKVVEAEKVASGEKVPASEEVKAQEAKDASAKEVTPEAEEQAEKRPAKAEPKTGGSLFDNDADADMGSEDADEAPESSEGEPSAETAAEAEADQETKAEPEAGDATQTEDTVTSTADVGPAAKASGGGSLFDVGNDAPTQKSPEKPTDKAAETDTEKDEESDTEPADEPESEPESEPAPSSSSSTATPATKVGGGSLFDIPAAEVASEPSGENTKDSQDTEAPEEKSETAETAETEAQPDLDEAAAPAAADDTAEKDEAEPETESDAPDVTPDEPAVTSTDAAPAAKIGGGSLFDIPAADVGKPASPAATAETEEPRDTEGTDDTGDTGDTETAAPEATKADVEESSDTATSADTEPAAVQPESEADSDSTEAAVTEASDSPRSQEDTEATAGAPDTTETTEPARPEPAAAAAPVAASSGQKSTSTSMFDLDAARAKTAAPAAAPSAPAETKPEPEPESPAEPEPAAESTLEADAAPAEPAASGRPRTLFDIKKQGAAAQADDGAGAPEDAAAEEEPADDAHSVTSETEEPAGDSAEPEPEHAEADAVVEEDVADAPEPQAQTEPEPATDSETEVVAEPEPAPTAESNGSSTPAQEPKKSIGNGSLFDL